MVICFHIRKAELFELLNFTSYIEDKPYLSTTGKALAELWMPVLAEFWLRKATQLSDGKDEEAQILFQEVRCKREYDPLINDHPIEVKFTQFGRAVYAKGETYSQFY